MKEIDKVSFQLRRFVSEDERSQEWVVFERTVTHPLYPRYASGICYRPLTKGFASAVEACQWLESHLRALEW